MIARHETHLDKSDIWSALSAPLPPGVISWRQDGRPISRDGRHIARFVAYIEANTVRERLDAVGTGKDYKQAATDAFKRAAVRFGIAHELYAYEQNWVQMDGDGKYARPLEDPAVAYTRRHGRPRAVASAEVEGDALVPSERAAELPVTEEPMSVPVATGPLASDEQSCPKC